MLEVRSRFRPDRNDTALASFGFHASYNPVTVVILKPKLEKLADAHSRAKIHKDYFGRIASVFFQLFYVILGIYCLILFSSPGNLIYWAKLVVQISSRTAHSDICVSRILYLEIDDRLFPM